MNILKASSIIFIVFISFKILNAQNYSEEKILFFDSDIVINEDASMIVTETIKVHSEGEQIKRGIYRDFPTRYKDKYGNNVVINFDIVEILRDGLAESYHTENLSNGVRVYIGKTDHFLSEGNYTYNIKYKTNRQIGYFENHDELYWNVTGNGWDFMIEAVTVSIHFPRNISPDDINIDAFTGYQGSAEKYFKVSGKTSKYIQFETTHSLLPKQGLTVVVMFPKGVVTEPAAEDKLLYFVEDNTPVIAALAGLIILLLYYISVWFGYGVDPKKGIIIPLFEPPDNLSPAAVRFIAEMGFDNKAYTASVLSIAVKGHLKIEEDNGEYSLIKTGNPKNELSDDEIKLLAKLKFSPGISKTDGKPRQALELQQKNHSTIRNSINELKKALKNKYEKVFFITNRRYFIIGLLISLLTVISLAVIGNGEQAFAIIWLSGWSAGVAVLLFAVFKSWRGVMQSGRVRFTSIGGAIFITLFSIPFVIGELAGFYFLSEFASPLLVLIVGIIVLSNIVFYHLLKAPTHLGRILMDKIEGFKMYLSTAEEDRIELFRSPEKTPELFDKFLPYALALNVENKWTSKFSGIISDTGAGKPDYSPLWYSGAGWSTLGAAGFVSSLGSSFSGSISSSSTAPGSSSGGSGGSSGGGGGGGGGGGW